MLLPYQAYVHYMPISLVLIMIYFWAINVGIMEYCGVKFPQIMGLSERYLRFSAIWMCTSLLAILMLSSLLVFVFVYEPVSPRRYIAYGVLVLSGLGCSIIEITKHTVVTSAWVDHNCGCNPIAANASTSMANAPMY